MKLKKMTKFEELKAIDSTLTLLEYWACRADEAGNSQQAQSFERGYAVFEEQKQTLVWALSPKELARYKVIQKTTKSKTTAKTVSKKRAKK